MLQRSASRVRATAAASTSELAAQIPNLNQMEKAAACWEYKALQSQVTASQLMAACKERMSDADCGMCLK